MKFTKKMSEAMLVIARIELMSALEADESLKTLDDARAYARRVECHDGRPLTAEKCSDFLRGLPFNVMYMTYEICKRFCWAIGLDFDSLDDSDRFDIDTMYWRELGEVLCSDKGAGAFWPRARVSEGLIE